THEPALWSRVSRVAGPQPEAPDCGRKASWRVAATSGARVVDGARRGAAAIDSREESDDAGHRVGRSRRTTVDDGILRDGAADVGESDRSSVLAVERAHRTRCTSTSSGARMNASASSSSPRRYGCGSTTEAISRSYVPASLSRVMWSSVEPAA